MLILIYVIALFCGDYVFSGFYPGIIAGVVCLVFDMLSRLPLRPIRFATLPLYLFFAAYSATLAVPIGVSLAWISAGLTTSWPVFLDRVSARFLRINVLTLVLLPLVVSSFFFAALPFLSHHIGRNNLYRIVISVYAYVLASSFQGAGSAKRRKYAVLSSFSIFFSFGLVVYIVLSLGSRFGILMLAPLSLLMLIVLAPSGLSALIGGIGSQILRDFSRGAKLVIRKSYIWLFAFAFFVSCLSIALLNSYASMLVSDRIMRYWATFASSDFSSLQGIRDSLQSQSSNRVGYIDLIFQKPSMFGELSLSTFNPHNILVDIFINYGAIFFVIFLFSLLVFFFSGQVSSPVKVFYLFLFIPALSSGYLAESFPLLAVVPFGLGKLINYFSPARSVGRL